MNALGGAGQIAGTYAELLSVRGHEVKTWGPKSAFAKLSSMDALTRLWFHLTDLAPQGDVAREIRAWRPDVLLTHNLTGCGFGTPQALRESGVRWVHVLHDVQLVEPSGQIIEEESLRFVRSLWRKFWSEMRHVAMKEPDVVVSPTKWLLDFHKKFGWFTTSRSEVIPNPVGMGLQPNLLNKRTDSVLFVGRLDRDKGIDLLVDAWTKITDTTKHLVIIGEGSWKMRLAQLKDSTIDVRGPLPNDEVRKIFAESKVAVLPSRVWENQPTVILEALAAGCHVVATDVGGVRETLGDAGWVVKPNSTEALASGIRLALQASHDETREKIRREILGLHDPEVAVERLEGVLKSNL